jgi:hypothetical protein
MTVGARLRRGTDTDADNVAELYLRARRHAVLTERALRGARVSAKAACEFLHKTSDAV